MCSMTSSTHQKLLVLGYSASQSWTEQPTQLSKKFYKIVPAQEENHRFGQNKDNLTEKGRRFPDHYVNYVQGEQKFEVK